MGNSKELGVILIHEHVFNLYPSGKKTKNEEFTLDLLNQLATYNVGCIVDLTPYANLNIYIEIRDSSPIPIICSVGFSYGKHVSSKDKKKSVDELYQEIEYSYLHGVSKRKLQPRFIKLATNTKEMKDYERRFALASIALSNKYSIPIAYHCPFNTYSNFCELLEMGANPAKLMICHYENQYARMEKDDFLRQAIEITSIGSYLQLNDFGSNEASQKAKCIVGLLKHLLDNGFANRVLLSSDCNWTWKKGVPQLKRGNMMLGYRYLFEYTLPLLKRNGIDDDSVELILKSNPESFINLG